MFRDGEWISDSTLGSHNTTAEGAMIDEYIWLFIVSLISDMEIVTFYIHRRYIEAFWKAHSFVPSIISCMSAMYVIQSLTTG